jgi:Protein of unknown function (DUF1761)
MAFQPISWLAVLIAAVASFIVGAIWYGVLGRQWMAALGWSEAEHAANRKPPVVPMIISFIAEIVMAFVLAGAIGHLGPGQTTIRNGIISGAILWAGFVLTTMVVNNAYAKRGVTLTAIDAGHWLAVLLVQGAVLGAIG